MSILYGIPLRSSTKRKKTKKHRSWWSNPGRRFSVIAFGLAFVLAVLIRWYGRQFDPVLVWLAAVNSVTFLMYGYDKAIAGSTWIRVPEKVLLTLTFTGGTAGALIAMPLFRHKTLKKGFRVKFALVVTAQIVLIVLYFVLREHLSPPYN